MARLARVVIPGLPHHVTQRGVRSLAVFKIPADFRNYIALMREHARRFDVEIWAWCLMSNHVHLIMVPSREDALAKAIGEAHRRFTLHVNERTGVRGHLFQERFHSFPVQTETYLYSVIRYVERNPVNAGIVRRAEDYPWSSARAHVQNRRDALLRGRPPLDLAKSWRAYLEEKDGREVRESVEYHSRTGRPWGDEDWIRNLERKTRRHLMPEKRGWKRGRRRKK